jgi:hypothetical protein
VVVAGDSVVLDPLATSVFSCWPGVSSSWVVLVLLVFGEVGDVPLAELADCLERFPDEGRLLIVGSVKLAIALDVLSRARAANVNIPVRFALVEPAVDWVD